MNRLSSNEHSEPLYDGGAANSNLTGDPEDSPNEDRAQRNEPHVLPASNREICQESTHSPQPSNQENDNTANESEEAPVPLSTQVIK